jgi:hypothetical protein
MHAAEPNACYLHVCMQEYGYLRCALLPLANLGVQDLPSGPLSICAACTGAQHVHSISIDFCYSLSHFAKCGSADVALSAPNQQLFLASPEIKQLLADSTGNAGAQADADRTCSEFNAARVVGRTSDKVRLLTCQ